MFCKQTLQLINLTLELSLSILIYISIRPVYQLKSSKANLIAHCLMLFYICIGYNALWFLQRKFFTSLLKCVQTPQMKLLYPS